MVAVYYPVSLTAYYTLGARITHDDVQDSLMELKPFPRWPIILSQMIIVAHLLTAIIISLNPFLQETERMVGVQNKDKGNAP